MQRRNFLKTVPTAGIAIGLTGQALGGCSEKEIKTGSFKDKSVLEKVIWAMLTMQRRTWEQGVVMQALLELGEEELVMLMIKDALLYGSGDGRLAMMGMIGETYVPLTDAAALGESLLWTANKTGEKSYMEAHKKLLDYMLHKAPRTDDGIVYHFTNFTSLPVRQGKILLTICDATFKRFPETMEKTNRIRFQQHLERSVQTSSGIIAISEFI